MLSFNAVLIFLLICLFVFFGLVVFVGAPYVPSHRKDVKRAFKYFGLSKKDLLVDVGSGDGVILRIASEYGAKAVGYEINPILVVISRLLSRRNPRVRVYMQNLWLARLPSDTTIVYAFAVNRDAEKLIALLQREANRLNTSLKLLCYASPFKQIPATEKFEAYSLYVFHPLQSKNA